LVWFFFVWFFWTKTGSNRFGLVFSVWLEFFRIWLGFFPVFFGLGSFWFFWFQAYKTKTEPVGFFKILIGFFHGSVFSIIIFLIFSV